MSGRSTNLATAPSCGRGHTNESNNLHLDAMVFVAAQLDDLVGWMWDAYRDGEFASVRPSEVANLMIGHSLEKALIVRDRGARSC